MKLTVNGSAICCLERSIATTGMVGAPAVFTFDSAWDTIRGRTAVFRCGDTERQVVLDEAGLAVIPAEVLHTPGRTLYIGVYGTAASGATWPAPTPFCDCGPVRLGAAVADEAADITPTLAQQVLLAAENAQAIAQSVRDDADNGAFDGADGRDGADGADGEDGHGLVIMGLYATLAALRSAHPTAQAGDAYAVGTSQSNVIYIWDGSDWVNLGSLSGPQGPAGQAGPNTVTADTTTTLNGVLAGNGSTVTTRAVSSSVTGGSTALVTSGAVYTAMQNGRPRVGTITLSATWSGSGPYTQTVTVTGATVTANSRVDLQLGAAALQLLVDDGVAALWVENNNGTLTAYALGAAPSAGGTVQCTVTEVAT